MQRLVRRARRGRADCATADLLPRLWRSGPLLDLEHRPTLATPDPVRHARRVEVISYHRLQMAVELGELPRQLGLDATEGRPDRRIESALDHILRAFERR